MKAQPIISSFNGGELSPLIGGRPDVEKYQAGLALCQNFIPRVQGALVRRGGTVFVAEVKDSAKRAWLVPFEFGVDDAFMLEFGDQYIRFYRGRGVFEDSPGHTYEIAAPWLLADLTNADGSFALQTTQSGDVVYIAHGSYQTRKLTRVSNTNWALAKLVTKDGPFKTQNIDTTVTVYATGADGNPGTSVTLTASSAIFHAAHVGSIFYLEMKDAVGIKPWSVNSHMGTATGIIVGTKGISDGKHYACSAITLTPGNDQVTGDVKPLHTFGKAWDGDGIDINDHLFGPIGVEWEYKHPGYGYALITAFTDSTHVTATVVSTLPDEVFTAPDATWRWAHGAWSDVEGWPAAVTFFRERLTLGAGQRCYFSVSGDFENFAAKQFGTVTADSAMNVFVQSHKGSTIQWLAAADKLLVGTGGSVFAVGEITTQQPFGPENIAEKDQNCPGATGALPVVQDAVIYVERAGRILNELAFNSDVGRYVATDLTVFAEHITLSGVVQLAWAKQPHAVVWAARADGLLTGFTYMKAQNVSGWHRHQIGGAGIVESVASIPSPDGSRDDVWLIVRRTINGVSRRYVEYVSVEYRDGDDQALATYSDSASTYSGSPTSTISGLSYLEGQTVNVKANGAFHRPLTVTSGAITLDAPASKVTVGLAALARGRLMPLDQGANGGTGQARPKRVNRLWARLYNSLGGRWGPNFNTMDRAETRTALDDMDQPPPLIADDDAKIEFPGDYDGRSTICFECDQDFPFTLVALMPELTTYGAE